MDGILNLPKLVSRSLDREGVPPGVLDYVMYHEMLHIRHGSEYSGGRRRIHTGEFRSDERRFEGWREAEAWLRENRI